MSGAQGVVAILRYNARFYLLSAIAGLLALLLAIQPMPFLLRAAFALLGALIFGLMASSLAVSHYVYDRSPLRAWSWLAPFMPRPPRRWAVVHAGLDEASPQLRRLYPHADGVVIDIYDPREMTEPAIARARALKARPEPAQAARPEALPLADASVDFVVLFFAAHEVRHPVTRELFFAELSRVLEPAGTLLLVEHLRDLPNLLAFGPGALHFLARAEWLRVATLGRLSLRAEAPITPFVRAFLFARNP